MSFILDPNSLRRLAGVHPDLVRVLNVCAASSDMTREGLAFIVTQGLRTIEQQKIYFAHGASDTMRSRHLDGHAVDVAMVMNGEPSWKWPLYYRMAADMKAAADMLKIPIVWGGDWKPPTIHDGCHFELPWDKYPSTIEQQSGQSTA